jgi:hypothetical protein
MDAIVERGVALGSAIAVTIPIACLAIILGVRHTMSVWSPLGGITLARPWLRTALVLLTLVLVPLILTACGGSGKSGY